MTEWHFAHETPYWWANSGIAGAGGGWTANMRNQRSAAHLIMPHNKVRHA